MVPRNLPVRLLPPFLSHGFSGYNLVKNVLGSVVYNIMVAVDPPAAVAFDAATAIAVDQCPFDFMLLLFFTLLLLLLTLLLWQEVYI